MILPNLTDRPSIELAAEILHSESYVYNKDTTGYNSSLSAVRVSLLFCAPLVVEVQNIREFTQLL